MTSRIIYRKQSVEIQRGEIQFRAASSISIAFDQQFGKADVLYEFQLAVHLFSVQPSSVNESHDSLDQYLACFCV